MMWNHFLCEPFGEFQIFSVFSQVGLTPFSVSYGHIPELTTRRGDQKACRSWGRSFLGWLRRRLIISMDRDKKAICSSFRVSNCWPLTITILSLMTPSWPCRLLGGMRRISKLLSCQWILLWFFPSQFYGTGFQKAEWGEQGIHFVCLSQILCIYRNNLKWGSHHPRSNKFSSIHRYLTYCKDVFF